MFIEQMVKVRMFQIFLANVTLFDMHQNGMFLPQMFVQVGQKGEEIVNVASLSRIFAKWAKFPGAQNVLVMSTFHVQNELFLHQKLIANRAMEHHFAHFVYVVCSAANENESAKRPELAFILFFYSLTKTSFWT